jgi:hypothetical protein
MVGRNMVSGNMVGRNMVWGTWLVGTWVRVVNLKRAVEYPISNPQHPTSN